MRIRQLTVQQFRNLQDICLVPDPELTVFSGANGQGKTNLLESIWMLSGAKSFRTYREAQLLGHGCSWCRIAGEVDTREDPPFPMPEKRIVTATDAAYQFIQEIEGRVPPPSAEEQAAREQAFIEARRDAQVRYTQEDIERMVAEDIENEAVEYRARWIDEENALREKQVQEWRQEHAAGENAQAGGENTAAENLATNETLPAGENAAAGAGVQTVGETAPATGESIATGAAAQTDAQPPYFPDKIEIDIRLEDNGRRTSRCGRKNGVDYGRAANLAGQFCCVVFEPGHIQMVSGAPDGRRKFLDAALCQLYPGYLENLHRYTRAVQQKNTLLKGRRTMKHIPYSDDLLDSFDYQMCAYARTIIEKRKAYCAGLAELAAARYEGISSGREKLQVTYRASVPNGEVHGAVLAALRAARVADVGLGYCTVGPHRDDIEFLLDGKPARMYASQGQCRSIALAVKIAELEMVNRVTGQTPVLLLDDVLSELDDMRQQYLLTRIKGRQVFVTGCEPQRYAGVAGKIVTLEGGRIVDERIG